MEYAQEVLTRLGKMEGRTRRLRYVEAVTCGSCGGTGRNPKYGPQSRCPVCAATGKIKVVSPVVACLRCGGSGCAEGDLTCMACKGAGVVSVRSRAATCPRCQGTGTTGIFILPRLQRARNRLEGRTGGSILYFVPNAGARAGFGSPPDQGDEDEDQLSVLRV